MRYLTDRKRHLVCLPYSIENLHKMANDLDINRRWYHSGEFPHYDIPKKRLDEISARCELISSRDIIRIIRGTY